MRSEHLDMTAAAAWNSTVLKLLKLSLYLIGSGVFVVLSLEFLLRFAFADPDYYSTYRSLFVSPGVYQNQGEGFWTYRFNTTIRELAAYGVSTLLPHRPKVFVEYDCLMKSNNVGLLQNDDIEPGSAATVIVGDSFTAGQGGCPWFDRLQARRKNDHLVNGGLMGTGFGHWVHLIEYLQHQGIRPERLLAIAISQDFERTAWIWDQAQLDCLERQICPAEDDPGLWLPVGVQENHLEMFQRTAGRCSIRFRHKRWLGHWKTYLEQNFYLYKFADRARTNVLAMAKGMQPAEVPSEFPVAEAALESFKSLHIPLHVLLVTQRYETGVLGDRRHLEAVVAALDAHGVGHSLCRLSKEDFMRYDGHPSRVGYDKLVSCVDSALDAMR